MTGIVAAGISKRKVVQLVQEPHEGLFKTISSKMDKLHKLHHKPSAGSKAAKKDVAKGIDRSGGKSYNPKVSLETIAGFGSSPAGR